jgi:hypothetical protein
MKRIVVALAVVVAAAGCAQPPGPPPAAVARAGPAPAGPTPVAVDPGPAPAPPPMAPPVAPPAPPAPSAPSAARAPAPAGLLQAIRTGRHPGYDRLVLEFGGTRPPAHQLRYVDRVTRDPSDLPVALRGKAFLYLVFHGATLDTSPRESDPANARRYTGPQRVTPNLPLLKDVAVAGDFEAVLSFGIGLARPAGLRVQTLTAPARLVVDVWYTAPRAPQWPDTTLAQARAAQCAADAGHQPWRCAAASVVAAYASAVLHWPGASVEAIGPQVYQIRPVTLDATAVVTVDRPVRRGGPCDVWDITGLAR